MQPSLNVPASNQILLVDDDPTVLESLRQTLIREGHPVVTAPNAVEALALFSKHSFSAIITDQRMPMLSGLEFLGQAKELQPDATRVLITAVLDLSVVLEAINKGEIYRFIVKPWLREELIVTVQNAIHRYELAVANRHLQTTLASTSARLTDTESRLETHLALAARQSEQLAALTSGRENFLNDCIELCVKTLEVFHPDLGGQARRVHQLCRAVAGDLNLSTSERRTLESSALLHDIGLIGVAQPTINRLINDPESLTTVERSLVEQHPSVGQHIVGSGPDFEEVGRLIRAHHEHFDGTGYPDGVSGEQIPWLARLLAVAVAFSESHRPLESTLATIESGQGTRFDPAAVQAFARRHSHEFLSQQRRMMSLEELRPGMVIASGIYTSSGLLLVPDGQQLTDAVIEKISNYNRMSPLSGSVAIYC